jgi:hypothetical protein
MNIGIGLFNTRKMGQQFGCAMLLNRPMKKKMAYVHLLYSKLCNSTIFLFHTSPNMNQFGRVLTNLYGTYFQSPPKPNPTPHTTMVELGAHCFMVVTFLRLGE